MSTILDGSRKLARSLSGRIPGSGIRRGSVSESHSPVLQTRSGERMGSAIKSSPINTPVRVFNVMTGEVRNIGWDEAVTTYIQHWRTHIPIRKYVVIGDDDALYKECVKTYAAEMQAAEDVAASRAEKAAAKAVELEKALAVRPARKR